MQREDALRTARDRSYETNAGDPEYSNAFTAIPSRTPATPHRTMPRPRIDGTQIALVAGPEGEEIHLDEHGRIKLWFHFRPLNGLKHPKFCLASPNGDRTAKKDIQTPAGCA